jgi:hypothetical protein
MNKDLNDAIIKGAGGAIGSAVGLATELIPGVGPFLAPVAGWLSNKFVDWLGHKIVDSGEYKPSTGIPAVRNDLVINQRHIGNIAPVIKRQRPMNLPMPIKLPSSLPLAGLIPPAYVPDSFSHGYYAIEPKIGVNIARNPNFVSNPSYNYNQGFGTSGFTQNDGFPTEKRRRNKKRNYKNVI